MVMQGKDGSLLRPADLPIMWRDSDHVGITGVYTLLRYCGEDVRYSDVLLRAGSVPPSSLLDLCRMANEVAGTHAYRVVQCTKSDLSTSLPMLAFMDQMDADVKTGGRLVVLTRWSQGNNLAETWACNVGELQRVPCTDFLNAWSGFAIIKQDGFSLVLCVTAAVATSLFILGAHRLLGRRSRLP
jgi:hypothetical protein